MTTIVVDQKVAALDPAAAHTLAGPVQSSQVLAPHADEVAEADGLRKRVVDVMLAAWMALGKAEASLSKGLIADAVQSIIPVLSLPADQRPKYATLSAMILKAKGQEVFDVKVVRLADGSLDYRMGKTNAYKQKATPYVSMARWEAGLWTKPEQKHQERMGDAFKAKITYGNEVYTSPVAALKDGVPEWTVYRLFKNAIAPSFLDLSDLHGSKSETLGKQQAKKIKVPFRKINDEGVAVKVTAPVAGNQALTVGLITGLLEQFKAPMSQSNIDKIDAALIKVRPSQKPA